MPKTETSKQSRSDAYYEALTAKIVAALETDPAGWTKPWTSLGGLPRNAITGKRYNGSNVFWLTVAAEDAGFATPNWATYRQWAGAGAQVTKGSKSTVGMFWKIIRKTVDGEPKTFPMMRTFSLFNLDQVEVSEDATDAQKAKLEALRTPVVLTETERNAAADAFIAATGAKVNFGGDRAFYRPSTDEITMPLARQFHSSEDFYATLAHELTHWTGAKTRLDRTGGLFGDPAYAFEELVAELGAVFLCSHLGIAAEPRPDHAQYVASWLKAVTDNERAVYHAAAKAAKAVDLLITLTETETE